MVSAYYGQAFSLKPQQVDRDPGCPGRSWWCPRWGSSIGQPGQHWLWKDPPFLEGKITMFYGKIHYFYGKIHYFDWAMFNSYVSHYQWCFYTAFRMCHARSFTGLIKFDASSHMFSWYSSGVPILHMSRTNIIIPSTSPSIASACCISAPWERAGPFQHRSPAPGACDGSISRFSRWIHLVHPWSDDDDDDDDDDNDDDDDDNDDIRWSF